LDTRDSTGLDYPNDSEFWDWDADKKLWVERDPQIPFEQTTVVSGYPRSGNTFLAFSISELYETKDEYLIRSHSTVSIKTNLDKNKDVCVAIREPLQAISSWHHFRTQRAELNLCQDTVYNKKGLTLDADFNFYIRYYSFVQEYLDKIALMNFAKFSNNSNYIMNKIFNKFNKKPVVNLSSEVLHNKLKAKGGRNFLPRPQNSVRAQIEHQVATHPLYKDVVDLYAYLTSKEESDDY
jgi:hypothetical protein